MEEEEEEEMRKIERRAREECRASTCPFRKEMSVVRPGILAGWGEPLEESVLDLFGVLGSQVSDGPLSGTVERGKGEMQLGGGTFARIEEELGC